MTGPGVTFPVVDDQVTLQLNQWVYRTKKIKMYAGSKRGTNSGIGKIGKQDSNKTTLSLILIMRRFPRFSLWSNLCER